MSTASKSVLVVVGVVLSVGIGFALFQVGTAEEPEDTLSAAAGSTPTSTTTSSTSSTTTSIPASTTTTFPPKGTVVIHGTGDVNLDPNYISALGVNGFDYAWEGVGELFRGDGVTVINLECAPTDIVDPEPKEFVFRCPTESLTSLASAGIEVASLGNNHSGDHGKDGLVDGRANLIEAGVAPVGAGKDATEAGLPAVFEVEGWKIAVVGFGGIVPNPPWIATDDRAGMRDGDDIPSMVAAVEAADEVADIVVVTIHWGVEFDLEPRADDIERAEAMVAAGADVIFGHHAHRLQPFEMVDGAAVFWGLGNFVWPNSSNAGSTTGVGRAIIRPDGSIEGCLIPAFIERPGQPVLTGEPECGPDR